MARPCTICQHPRRADIDKALVANEAYRSVAKRYGVSDSALYRHREHVAQSVADGAALTDANPLPRHAPALAEQAAAQREARQVAALDVFAELQALIHEMRQLRAACDEWLRDPDDPAKLNVGPRADDVLITYQIGGRGKPQRATLAELLKSVKVYARIEHIEFNQPNPAELLIKAGAAMGKHLVLWSSALDKVHNAQEVEAFQRAVVETIGAADPDARDRILAALRARGPLGGLAGPAGLRP